jgi:hypothetical protein
LFGQDCSVLLPSYPSEPLSRCRFPTSGHHLDGFCITIIYDKIKCNIKYKGIIICLAMTVSVVEKHPGAFTRLVIE